MHFLFLLFLDTRIFYYIKIICYQLLHSYFFYNYVYTHISYYSHFYQLSGLDIPSNWFEIKILNLCVLIFVIFLNFQLNMLLWILLHTNQSSVKSMAPIHFPNRGRATLSTKCGVNILVFSFFRKSHNLTEPSSLQDASWLPLKLSESFLNLIKDKGHLFATYIFNTDKW